LPERSSNNPVRPIKIEDARKFAEMMNRSRKGWPWDMDGGVSWTTSMARAEIEGNASMGYYVAQVEDKLVGVCEIFKSPWDRESSYVGFLNVEPDFHGKKFGKRLLRMAVDRAIQEGIDRITLNTWSGNLKALPLYKKMGFFWIPETHVEMVSFLPIILKHPMFEDFFRENPDWYEVQERDLSPKEDILERDGIRIYEYVFRSGGREIRATADRTGNWLTGGSNSSIEIWIHPEYEVNPEGLPQKMFWEIVNRGISSLEATLMVEAPEGIEIIDPPEQSLAIGPQKRVRLVGTYRIDPGRERKDYWEPDRIETRFILGGRAMHFKTGLGRDSALQVSYDPAQFLVHPGARTDLNVRIKNRTKLPLEGNIAITPLKEAVRVNPRTSSFKLEPEGQTGFGCEVEIDEEAPTSLLPVLFSPKFTDSKGGEVDARQETLHISCVRPGDTLAYMMLTGKVLQLNTDRFRLSIDLRWGGKALIRDRFSEERVLMGFGGDALGPPFWPTEFDRKMCDYHLEEGNGFVRATIYMKSELHKGLTLFKEYTLRTTWPTLTMRYGLINDHRGARRFRLRMSALATLDRPRIFLPTRYGLISERIDTGYPSWLEDAPKKPRDYSENWVAMEGFTGGRQISVGCIWPGGTGEIKLSHTSLGELKMDLRVGARDRCTTPPIYYHISEGSWRGIREVWRKLVGGTIGVERRCLDIETRGPLSFGFSDKLIFNGPGPVQGEAFISNLRSRRETGRLEISPPDGWTVSPSVVRFRNLHWRTRTKRVRLKPPAGTRPGVYQGSLTLLTEEKRRHKAYPAFNLGGGQVDIKKIEDRGREAYLVSNPTMNYRLCPSFGGIVYSLMSGDLEFLASSFPSEKPHFTFNPWFGGISGQTRWESSKGWQERHVAREASRGIWSGVETVCRPGKFMKDLKGLAISTGYFLAKSSNIMKIEQEITNTTGARMEVQCGVNVFVGLGEEEDIESVVPDDLGMPYSRPRGDDPKLRFRSPEGWIAFRNPRLDGAIILSGYTSDRGYVGMEESRGCLIMNATMRSVIEPGGSTNWAYHLALCSSSLDEIAMHRHIRELVPTTEPLAPS